MKIKFFIPILGLVFLFTTNCKAQNVSTATFLKDFYSILEDGKNGFPNTKGDLKESIGWYGNTYATNKYIFEKSTLANLQYIKAHEPTKYVPEATPELFYFGQAFKVGNIGFEFIKDSLETILDEVAKELGLTKKTIKQTKEYKKIHRKIEYQKNGKAVFAIFNLLDATYYEVQIYSPYRPGDVPKPKNRLGCIVFNYKGFVFAYAVTVYGERLDGGVESIVQRAFKATGLVDKNYIYTWYPKKSVDEVSIQIGKGMTVRDSGSITID